MDMFSIDTLMYMCEAVDPGTPRPESTEPLDPERFQAYIKSPGDIDEQTIRDIASVIDGKLNVNPPDIGKGYTPPAVPSTVDRLLNSLVIIYITDNGIPIAAATLVDPTVESYRGFVPLSHYSLESGYNLDGRVQQEFFAVADEYRNHGIGRELKAQIGTLGTPTFILADAGDTDSIEGLAKNGYRLVCEMDDGTGDDSQPVQLWIDHADEDDSGEDENGITF